MASAPHIQLHVCQVACGSGMGTGGLGGAISERAAWSVALPASLGCCMLGFATSMHASPRARGALCKRAVAGCSCIRIADGHWRRRVGCFMRMGGQRLTYVQTACRALLHLKPMVTRWGYYLGLRGHKYHRCAHCEDRFQSAAECQSTFHTLACHCEAHTERERERDNLQVRGTPKCIITTTTTTTPRALHEPNIPVSTMVPPPS